MLGVGSMGGAILSGLRAPEVQVDGSIIVTTNSTSSASVFDGADDVIAYAIEREANANKLAVREAKVVILAVKPWMIHDVLREVAGSLEQGAIVVSVAAGVTTASMEELVPKGVSVVRAMPNTPSHIGRGVTGVAGGSGATDADIAVVRDLFRTVGAVLVVGEERIDALSAVSGSGPAYLYFFAEAFTAATRRLGFSEDETRLLVQGTVSGAAELMLQSDEDPAQLRRNVTSPNGTTEQAMNVLLAGGWEELFDEALAAAVRRSKELAGG